MTFPDFSDGIGKGSTFSVTLNTVVKSQENTCYQNTSNISEGNNIPQIPLNILLVEDNKTTNCVMTRLLSRLGHKVESTFKYILNSYYLREIISYF